MSKTYAGCVVAPKSMTPVVVWLDDNEVDIVEAGSEIGQGFLEKSYRGFIVFHLYPGLHDKEKHGGQGFGTALAMGLGLAADVSKKVDRIYLPPVMDMSNDALAMVKNPLSAAFVKSEKRKDLEEKWAYYTLNPNAIEGLKRVLDSIEREEVEEQVSKVKGFIELVEVGEPQAIAQVKAKILLEDEFRYLPLAYILESGLVIDAPGLSFTPPPPQVFSKLTWSKYTPEEFSYFLERAASQSSDANAYVETVLGNVAARGVPSPRTKNPDDDLDAKTWLSLFGPDNTWF